MLEIVGDCVRGSDGTWHRVSIVRKTICSFFQLARIGNETLTVTRYEFSGTITIETMFGHLMT